MNLIHTIYRPPGAGPHPTILTLHGRGANAFDLLGLAPYLGGGKFLIICPQAPLKTPIGPETVGYAWYNASKGGVPDTDGMLESRQALQLFLDDCLKSYPIDPRRLAVLGFSQGGVIAYSLALTEPERFAGLAALSTWLPPRACRLVQLWKSCRPWSNMAPRTRRSKSTARATRWRACVN